VIGFGEQLRRAREAKGLTLEEVVDATRITRRHLEALERGDLRALPAGPFAKGYIEACAKVLDVDAGPILAAWRAEARRLHLDAGEARDRTIEEMSQIVGQRAAASARADGARGRTVALVLAALVLLAVVAALLLRGRTPAEHPAATMPPTATPSPGAASAIASPPAGAAPAGPGSGPATPAPVAPTVPPALAPTPSPPPRPNPDLRVADSGVGTGIANHRLVGRGERFVEGSEVVFWTLVVGGRPGDSIRQVWFEDGRAVMRADLEVGGPHWRTYSRLGLPRGAAGAWAVEARDPEGRLLARQEFLCVPAER
jgi:transcriptional regulator with XRE-family HTH domain